MFIRCPLCQHLIELKGIRPGRFTPKCDKCARKFLLVIADDTTTEPWVSELTPMNVNATVAPAAAPAKPKKSSAVSADSSATMPPVSGDENEQAAPVSRPSRPATRHAAPADVTSAPPMGPHGVAPGLGQTSVPAAAVRDEPAPAPVRAASSMNHGAGEPLPAVLGGCQILSKLGQGGMGAVYRAKQLSLDRDVAVKVMNAQWANDPQFVARFTREAYAAAQLTHHHVVQIYDIGVEKQNHFFSMEFVKGQSLADLLTKNQKLDPEVAAGYALQAARGLKQAHDMGMVHRDIKPENLLLSEHGMVKVADLGLVKTPGLKESGAVPQSQKLAEAASANETMANVSMGTPAYMPPEQASDAAHVDHRADIYSLGCTLYHMITGRTPFDGKTAIEVISKHQTQAVTPPEIVVKRVPKELSVILLKMMAKQPADRYQSMDEVIKAIEGYLGLDSSAPFSPREEHANILEDSVAKFNSAKKAKLRKRLILAYYIGVLLLAIACGAMGSPMYAGMFVGMAVLTFLSYIVTTGITQKTFLFRKMRQFVFGASVSDWLMALFIGGVSVVALHALGWLLPWIVIFFVAAGAAIAMQMFIDRALTAERAETIKTVDDLLRTMRLKGLDEDALRHFVCKFSGKHWEEFYEALFGYEDKITARQRWGKGDGGKLRPKFAAWRDAMIALMEKKQKARQDKREKRMLQKLEQERLKAEGLSAAAAKATAEKAAAMMVNNAGQMRVASHRNQTVTQAPGLAATSAPMAAMKAAPMKNLAKQMAEADTTGQLPDLIEGTGMRDKLKWIFGPRARFVLGALLLTGCLLWMKQNDMVQPERFKQWASETYQKVRTGQIKNFQQVKAVSSAAVSRGEGELKPIEPLKVAFLPESSTKMFNNFWPALAGIVLIISFFYDGITAGFFLVPAAILLILGEKMGVPKVGPLSPQLLSAAIAGALTAFAYIVRNNG